MDAPFNFTGRTDVGGDHILEWENPPELTEIKIVYEDPANSDNWETLYVGSPITSKKMPAGSANPTKAKGQGKEGGGTWGPLGPPSIVSF